MLLLFVANKFLLILLLLHRFSFCYKCVLINLPGTYLCDDYKVLKRSILMSRYIGLIEWWANNNYITLATTKKTTRKGSSQMTMHSGVIRLAWTAAFFASVECLHFCVGWTPSLNSAALRQLTISNSGHCMQA